MPAWSARVGDLLNRQAGPPPMTPDYIDFDNAPRILAISGAFFTAAALVILLRCYVRVVMLKVFGIDDYVMAFAAVIAAATFACFKLETDNGLGKHTVVLLSDPMLYMRFARLLYVHAILVMVGISTVKISIAFFLLRLSIQEKYRRSLYGIMAFIVVITFTCAMTLIFQCIPVEAAWDARLRPPPYGTGRAKCYSLNIFRNLGLMNSVFNILTDITFATIPIPLIWKLQLNTKKRVSLIVILSLGWFACAAGIIKAVQQWHVLTDPDWTVYDSFNLWNYIEFTVGIIAASLPSLRPLFNWFYESARAFTTGRSKGSEYKRSGYKGGGSLGYQKQSEGSSSFGLQSFSSRKNSMPRGPYNVQVTSAPMGRADKEAWDILHAKNSNESIIPLQDLERNPHGILMTKEVRISR